ncbi:MAG: formyl transferase [Cyanobacteria bacterium HKST-UBA05]|nr:formyl transferase [Cyanobacteria bacterium HKST-UBA05]
MSPTTTQPINRVALAGDTHGLAVLLEAVPKQRIGCLIAAGNRPQYIEPLEAIAHSLGVPLLVQPKPCKTNPDAYRQFLSRFVDTGCNGLFCFSYAMKLQPDLLACLEGRAFNCHAALLPRHRGPNPIQWALIHGDEQTGVTLHQMSPVIDEGGIVAQLPVDIDDGDTWTTLRDKIDTAARQLLVDWLPKLLAGAQPIHPQESRQALSNPRLTPEYPRIDFAAMDDRQIFNLIRAQVAPLRGAYIELSESERLYLDHYMPYEDVAKLRQTYDKPVLFPANFC